MGRIVSISSWDWHAVWDKHMRVKALWKGVKEMGGGVLYKGGDGRKVGVRTL
jgi:hypothetical protein